MQRKKGRWLTALLIAAVSLSVGLSAGQKKIEAAGETASFGSASYEWEQGEEVPLGVYISSDTPIYFAEMTVVYDPKILQYSSGGELETEGRVKVEAGGGGNTEISQMLYFVPVQSGTTEITIENASVQYESGETASAAAVSASVTVALAEGCALNALTVNGEPLAGFQSDILSYTLDVEGDMERIEVSGTAQEDTTTVEVSDTALVVGTNTIQVTTTNAEGRKAVYTLTVNRAEPVKKASEQKNIEEKETDAKVEVISKKNTEGSTAAEKVIFLILTVLFFILILLLFILECISRKKRRRRHRRVVQQRRQKEAAGFCQEKAENRKVERTEAEEIEIDVQHVTMVFKREKDEATSIKELLIRTIKKQRSYEMFKALDDVSFTVHKGEVVGIIGTNGSGKSTILKIISGVLAPTKGRVEVDKSKIQLLTLGTGFDFELTGRENVYLNGAIIGYTKEFIDEKYEEIVKFAELEGFMEEKVRNYSSGMVSRLGFAIATVRDTPEILILDEVLSVGDMFFQKKSAARIKEMMQGGSTVLIVSHSTSVIKSNCTKAVWIEKGKLRAVGEPEEVCAAYEKLNQGNE